MVLIYHLMSKNNMQDPDIMHGSISFQKATGSTGPDDMYITDDIRAVFEAVALGIVRMSFKYSDGARCNPPAGLAVQRGGQVLVQQIIDTDFDTRCYDVSIQESYTIKLGNEDLYNIVPQMQSYVKPSPAGSLTKARALAAAAAAAAAHVAALAIAVTADDAIAVGYLHHPRSLQHEDSFPHKR